MTSPDHASTTRRSLDPLKVIALGVALALTLWAAEWSAEVLIRWTEGWMPPLLVLVWGPVVLYFCFRKMLVVLPPLVESIERDSDKQDNAVDHYDPIAA